VRYEYPSNKNDACPNKLDNDDRPNAAEDEDEDDDEDDDNRANPGKRLNSRTMIGCMLNGVVVAGVSVAEAQAEAEAEADEDSDATARLPVVVVVVVAPTPPPPPRRAAKSFARRTAPFALVVVPPPRKPIGAVAPLVDTVSILVLLNGTPPPPAANLSLNVDADDDVDDVDTMIDDDDVNRDSAIHRRREDDDRTPVVVAIVLLLLLGVSLFRSRHPPSSPPTSVAPASTVRAVFDRRPTDAHSMKLHRNLRRSVFPGSKSVSRIPSLSVNTGQKRARNQTFVPISATSHIEAVLAVSTDRRILYTMGADRVLLNRSVYHAVAAHTMPSQRIPCERTARPTGFPIVKPGKNGVPIL